MNPSASSESISARTNASPALDALRAEGARDASLGVERVAGTLVRELAARSVILDEVRADVAKKREAERVRHDRAVAKLRQTCADAVAAAEKECTVKVEGAEDLAAARVQRANEEREARLEELDTTHAQLAKDLDDKRADALMMAEALYEAAEETERKQKKDLEDRLNAAMRKADELEGDAKRYIRSCRLAVPGATASDAALAEGGDTLDEIDRRLLAGEEHLESIRNTPATKLLAGKAPVILLPTLIVLGLIGGLVAAILGAKDGELNPVLLAIGGGGALVVALAIMAVLRSVASSALKVVWQPFQADLAAVRALRERALVEAKESREARFFGYKKERKSKEREAHEKYDAPIAEVPRTLKRRREKAVAASEVELKATEDERVATIAAATARRDQLVTAATTERDRLLGDEASATEATRSALVAEEASRLADARRHWIDTGTRCRELLAWTEGADAADRGLWNSLDPERDGIVRDRREWFRYGTVTLRPTDMPGGTSDDPEARVELPEAFSLPAALGFPNRGNLVVETTPETRTAALRAVQSLVARLLVSIPPSKVRFTFMDPVGLGESFAAFMRLGDEFEQLVGERIWTDPRAIEQRLVDISEHMETVIQKYLRNEFEDIDAYNDAAGEIAEPYRFLVCADFPTNFSDQAAARLNSILRAGQRCGVHVILLRDQKSAFPEGIAAEDIASNCIVLQPDPARKGAFRVASGPFAQLPLELDTPPSDAKLIPLLSRIGHAAKHGARVEVPFDVIAPKPEAFWSMSSAANLRVPVGRSGATRLQQFLLGEGTSQHALIAGKTGSGKSTLLHAIITGIATWYSPDEVELWLVDFKKGVEFKTYAEHALPHARAVAIESDREFGLSVLEGLDAELARRGELYREVGVQDLASFRKARPETRMPRVLLVIDEFQEFFLDDDKVSQGAAMLLDRIVRQGRAFGIHALLGSQTLGGAYSLARSTMGQMGVRIALQCSEADSQLILSDDNLAARLLSRPGEAIYNDAGGRPEGNSPFQVAFLPDERRDFWLDDIEARAKGRFDALPRIVFEGDARAAMRLNPAVRGAKPDPRGAVRVWFGEAVAIKDPTCARLARAAGANIAGISPRDDQAVSTSAAMLLSVAAESPDSIIDVFDGTPADAPEYGVLERIARDRGLLERGNVRFVPYREVDARLAEIAQDVTERGEEAGRARRYLLIHQLQRFRMLRRNEDDFSFGASDAPPTPDKLLAGIVKEGPVSGVHTLVMSDTLASFQRAFDRNTVREFDWKALFQISPADSSALIDSPAASRLGTNRGLLHSEELGLLEKFRPYAL